MNNFVKILVAGVIANLSQRMLGFSSLTLEGFALFMVMFILISLVLGKLFPNKPSKKEELTQALEQIEKTPEEKRVDNKVQIAVISVALSFVGFLSYDYYKAQLWEEQLASEKITLEKIKKQKKIPQDNETIKSENRQEKTPQVLSKLTVQELANNIHKLYLETAFLKKSRYAITLFDEYYARDEIERREVRNIDVYGYRFLLMTYLNVFKNKERLNQILRQYHFGAVYSFILPITSAPLDTPATAKKSHLRIVDMNTKLKYFLHQKNDVKVFESIINNIKNLTEEDKIKVRVLITKLITGINLIEKEYLRDYQRSKTSENPK